MSSELGQFSQLTIRKGLCGILQEASRIECDAACQESLRQHLNSYLSDKFRDGSEKEQRSSYFYIPSHPRQFHTILHDPERNISYVGYHIAQEVSNAKSPGESMWVWHHGKRLREWKSSLDSPPGPNRMLMISEGAAKQSPVIRQLTLEEISKSIVLGEIQKLNYGKTERVSTADTNGKATWAGSIVDSFKRVKENYSGELADVMLHYTDPRLSPSVLTGSTFYFSVDGKAAKAPDHSWPNEVVSTSEIQEPPSSPTETQPPPSARIETQPSTQASTPKKGSRFFKKLFSSSK